MSEHTPGSWAIATTKDARSGWAGLSVKAENGHFVANVVTQVDDRERANARLIAAAPDLLAALQKVVALANANRLLVSGSVAEIRDFGQTLDGAREAIAKAKGGAQ